MKRFLVAAAAAGVMLGASVAHAQAPTFFRIVSGAAGGNYFPLAGLLANAVSNPPGSRPCDQGGACGVPGLIAIAQSANGSVANVNSIQSGTAESGLVQSDVAYWAFTGTGTFEGRELLKRLTVIANLYPEHIHVVLPRRSTVQSLQELKGKRISVGLPASGAQVGALLILNAAGLEKNVDFPAEELNTAQSAERIQDGQIEAFLTVTGAPAAGIAQLAATAGLRLLSISDDVRSKVIEKAPFYFRSPIPASTYEGVDYEAQTLAVGAQWLVAADQPEELIYGITQALWNDTTRKLLDSGHSIGRHIQLSSALDAISIPIHPGAERFYREKGLIN